MSHPRAWSTRAFYSPARWARSVSSLTTIATVSIVTRRPRPDGYGGFRAEGPVVVWTGEAYVEREADEPLAGPLAGPERGFHYVVIIPTSAIPKDDWPRKGDRVRWTDARGNPHDLEAAEVQDPLELLDHFEIETEDEE